MGLIEKRNQEEKIAKSVSLSPQHLAFNLPELAKSQGKNQKRGQIVGQIRGQIESNGVDLNLQDSTERV